VPVKGPPEFGYFLSGIFIHIDFQKKILAALSVQILDDVLPVRLTLISPSGLAKIFI